MDVPATSSRWCRRRRPTRPSATIPATWLRRCKARPAPGISNTAPAQPIGGKARSSPKAPSGCTRDGRFARSKAFHSLADVLDFRRRGEAMADQLAPFLKVGGAAEIDGVGLDRLPFDEQAIARRLFDRALQLHAVAALGALEQWRGVFHAGFELGFHAGLDVDLGDFGNHFIWLPGMRKRSPDGASAKSGTDGAVYR